MSTTDSANINYTIRTMTEADIPALVDFYNALEAVEPTGESYSVAEYQQAYQHPDNRHYTRLMAHRCDEASSEGQLIGYGIVYKPASDTASWSRLHVLPKYRHRGLGAAIYRQLEEIVSNNGSLAWRVAPHQSYTMGIEFWQRRGFVVDRYSWQMRLPAAHEVPSAQIPDGFTIRNYVPGQDDEALWRVSNDAFAEHHWHHPLTLEERLYWTRQPGFHPSDIFFACAGDRIAGYCWTGISEAEIQRRGMDVGWIHDLGVIPTYQRRGLGRALLLSGIHYLRERVSIVELGVEGKNRKALPLYESIGFSPYSGNVNMEKLLPRSALSCNHTPDLLVMIRSGAHFCLTHRANRNPASLIFLTPLFDTDRRDNYNARIIRSCCGGGAGASTMRCDKGVLAIWQPRGSQPAAGELKPNPSGSSDR